MQVLALLALLSTLASQLSATPLGTAFNYQGRLTEGGNAANGVYDFRFTIYDAMTEGNAASGVLTNVAAPVTNGLFAMELDFGPGVFNGQARWLEIGVRRNGVAMGFTTLTPRQALMAGPYALYAPSAGEAAFASSVDASNITGTVPLARLPSAVVTNQCQEFSVGSITASSLLTVGPAERNIQFTNGTWSTITFSPVVNPSDRQGLFFSGLTSSDAGLWYWPNHGGDGMTSPEMLLTSRGSMAFSAGNLNGGPSGGSRAFQFGIGGAWHNFMYLQYDGFGNRYLVGGDTNLGTTIPICFHIHYFSNSVERLTGSGALYGSGYMPGILGRATETNGDGAISFYDSIDTGYNSWATGASTPRFEVRISPDAARGGVSINGGITINGATGLTTNYAMTDGNTMCFSNGLLVAILPTPPHWDVDATNYLERIGASRDTELATNINAFVKRLKIDNTWSSLQALYTFSGADSAANGQNLISTNYTIQWGGIWATNDSTGIRGAVGGNAYGNTTFTNNATNGSAFVFIKANTNGSNASFFGVQKDSGANAKGIKVLDNAAATNATYGTYAFSSFGTATAWYPTSWPSSLMIQRLDANYIRVLNNGSATGSTSAVGTTGMPDTLPIYLGCRNNQGSAQEFSLAHFQGFAFTTNVLSGAQYKTLHDAFVVLNAALGR